MKSAVKFPSEQPHGRSLSEYTKCYIVASVWFPLLLRKPSKRLTLVNKTQYEPAQLLKITLLTSKTKCIGGINTPNLGGNSSNRATPNPPTIVV